MKAYKIFYSKRVAKSSRNESHRLTNQTVLSSVHLVWFNVIKKQSYESEQWKKLLFMLSQKFVGPANCFSSSSPLLHHSSLAHVVTRKCSAMATYAKLVSQKGNNSLRVCDSDCPQLLLNKRYNNRVSQKSSPHLNFHIRLLTLFNTHACIYGNFSVPETRFKTPFSQETWNEKTYKRRNSKNITQKFLPFLKHKSFATSSIGSSFKDLI